MRKISLIAAVAAFCLVLQGCQFILIQEPQTNTGQDTQNKDPDSQQEPETDPVLKVKYFGAYGIDGEDYVYKRGEWQMSRQYTSDGREVTFNMMDPVNGVVYSLSGIRTAVALPGHNIFVSFSAKKAGKEFKSLSASSKVLEASGDTLWLKTASGAYFVVKK